MNNVEILAPAGSMESLFAAINNGADAVYLGGSKFSARAYASNFDNENMKKAVDYCHVYNVKIYVTMNTLLKEHELKEAIKYVGYLYEIGVDALIIQDTGLIKLIRERYPDFEIHASTQLTIHNGEGALYFKEKGFTRIVLSRELSFKEIEYISKELNIETEIFIHGALCVCYSGQCLMSSMIGGRSGNRGRCAQPCRMEYTLTSEKGGNKKGYLLSPKDMCTIDDVKSLINTGAYSFKIEGRMKRPEYVAGVVNNYRNAVDKELYNKKFDVNKAKRTLMQLFNRSGFSKAYLVKNVGRDMMSYNFPKNTGVEIGKVDNSGFIVLKEDISLGDGIRAKDNGFTISKILLNNNEVKLAKRGDKVKLFPRDYKNGDLLFRTSSKELFSSLEKSIKPYEKKILLSGRVNFKINEPIELMVQFDDKEYKVLGDVVSVAEKKPVLKERIEESLMKSGDYPYKFDKITFDNYEEGFIRVSSLNNLRRELFEQIMKDLASRHRRRRVNINNVNENIIENNDSEIIYTCTTKEQLDTLMNLGIKNIGVDIFSREKDGIREITNNQDVKIYILTPEIIKGEFDKVCSVIDKNIDKIHGIITSNHGMIKRYKGRTKLIGDYKLNIFNSESAKFYREDLDIVNISLELNRKEIKEFVKNYNNGLSFNLYGKTELMVSEYCPIGSTFGGKCTDKECSMPCLKDRFTLIDRKNERFRVMTDAFCRSHIMNSVATNLIDEKEDLESMGINNFRVDFKDESSNEVIRVIDMINQKMAVEGKYYTKGHYKRGVE